MLQQPTSKEHKRSRQGPTMPNTAEMHLKRVTKCGGRIHFGIQNRNHLKRFIHRNPEIPDSDSEYGSDNEDLVPASQESGIASQESVPASQESVQDNTSPVPSDADTVLYANPDKDQTLLSHTLIKDAVPTLPKMTVQIPVQTPTVCDDDGFLRDLADTDPATPVHTERTLSAADILADLADGGVVSGHDECAESLQLQLEVSTTSEQQPKDAEEVDVVNTWEVDVENTQYKDQTMETSDPDLIVNGVEDLKPMGFHPFNMYMRKQVVATVNLSVGRKHGLGLRVDVLRYHGAGEQCTDNFQSKTPLMVMEIASSGPSLTCCWGQRQSMIL